MLWRGHSWSFKWNANVWQFTVIFLDEESLELYSKPKSYTRSLMLLSRDVCYKMATWIVCYGPISIPGRMEISLHQWFSTRAVQLSFLGWPPTSTAQCLFKEVIAVIYKVSFWNWVLLNSQKLWRDPFSPTRGAMNPKKLRTTATDKWLTCPPTMWTGDTKHHLWALKVTLQLD